MISVIVPVYKVEAYLDQCVQSIVSQTYTDLEIILVDDGSPDHCPAMCDAWAERDSRIKVIHTKNYGAAKARNAGLAHANGDYIAFVDSDDILHPHIYQTLMRVILDTNSDIAECDYSTFESTSSVKNIDFTLYECSCFDTQKALQLHIRDQAFRQIIWNKLYKKECITVPFVEGKIIDDEFWTYRIIASAKKLSRISLPLYYYRQHGNSIMHQSFSLKRLQALEAKKERLSFIQSNFPALSGEAKCNLYFTCIYLYQMALKYCSLSKQSSIIPIIKFYCKNISIQKKDFQTLSGNQRFWMICAILSLDKTCRIRNALHKGF